MPVPTETLYNMRKANVWFAAASVILALSTGWMIWVDWARPWKDHQDDHMDALVALSEFDYLVTQQESFQEQLQQAEARVEQARHDIDRDQNQDYSALLDRLLDRQADAYKLNLTFKQKDAWISVTRTEFERAAALESAEGDWAQRVTAKLTQDEEDLAVTRLEKEEVDDEIADIKRQIKKIEQKYRTAERELGDLQKLVDAAKDKRDRYNSKINRMVFNMPLGDFAAPPRTPGRYELKQVVLMGVRSKLNFLEGYKVDRCTTCHLTIDDRAFTQQSLTAQFERAIPAIMESLAKSDTGQAPTVTMPPPPQVYGLSEEQLLGNVAAHWDRVSREDREPYFESLQEQVNLYLSYANLAPIDVSQPLQAHPDLDLFLTSDSPHPLNEMGCTVCHEGSGSETDFVLAAHTPKTHEEKREWTEKYYDRNAGMPTMTWETMEHFWDFPMIPPTYSEASCAKCHENLDDIARFQGQDYGEKINFGKKLYTQLGCINCHRVENIDGLRQVGTDLAHVGSKLSDGFMHNWIYNPGEFRPSTWMPHFFMQENNGPDSANVWDPDPVLRTRTEVQAATYYLKTVSKPWSQLTPPADLTGDVARGQQLFAEVGCLACHGNMAEYGQAWIAEDLAERRLTAEPDADEDEVYEEAEGQAAEMDINAQIKFAITHFTEDRHRKAQKLAKQEELLALAQRRDPDPRRLYVPPLFTRFAPDLSGIGSKVTKDWLYSWVLEPQHYSGYTKMPSLRLTAAEGLDLAEYLSTLKLDSFDQTPFPETDDTYAELDRRLQDILSGQNSQTTIERYKKDENGLLTRTVVTLLSKHSDRQEQTQRRAHFEGLLSGMDLNQKKMLFVGQKVITHYGCYACHEIQGFESAPRPGTELTDWGEKNIHQLDFAFFSGAYHHTLAETSEFQVLYPENRDDLANWSTSGNPEIDLVHTHASFARHKMLNPRIFDRQKIKRPYAKLKMPNFYLADDEVEALVTYLLSRRPPRVVDSLRVQYDRDLAGPIAAGRQLIDELNCVGCHKIETNMAPIHQFITVAEEDEEDDWDEDEEDEEDAEGEDAEVAMGTLGDSYGGDFDVVNGPPWLRGQGAKVQAEWFHGFLLNIETLRPWLKVRMPSFYLTSDQASTLVEYFAALSKKESQDLQKTLKETHKYIAEADDPHQARGDWYRQEGPGRIAPLLDQYVVENEVIKANAFDFSGKTDEQVEDVHRQVLKNVEFFAHLYDVQYPFESNDYTPLDSERFKLGEGLFTELNCLKCHVLGDSEVLGSNQAPSAPNLDLTYKRLRYEWFLQWMQDPAWIQPNTSMPQWFPGGRSAYGEYIDEIREPYEAAYTSSGDTQMHLLIDFVWQAGMTKYTAINPALLPGNEGQPAAADEIEADAPAEAQPAAQRMPSIGKVLKTPIADAISVGPKPAGPWLASGSGGSVIGRVVWVGGDIPNDRLPVASAFRQACCPDDTTKAFDRLTIDAASGGLADCVVYLAGEVSMLPPASQPVEVSITHCQFDQRVALVPRGGTVRFVNTDDLAHNIRGRLGETLLWSRNLIEQGSTADFKVDKLGIVQTRSGSGFDWMDHYVWVIDHAGYALSDGTGRFVLDHIPAGTYTLHAWHPGIRRTTSEGSSEPAAPVTHFEPAHVVGGEITIREGRTTEVVIEMQ